MSKHAPSGIPSRSGRAVGILARILVASLALALLAPAVAHGATAPAFVPQLVISDDVLRAAYAMNAADIQAFLERQTGVLDTTLAPRHSDGTMQPVSLLIAEVCQEFSINPKVMLTMLQKEQGLLTKTAPSQTALDWAFGFGCPDGVPIDARDPAYKGLGNQIWYAARALDGYAQTSWTPTTIRTICTDCVTNPAAPIYDSSFKAANLATFKLYVYTPHSHDSTIGGGNYLFWVVYWRYFDEGPLANPALRPVYRFYNKVNGSHFYTASEAERYTVMRTLASTYTFEGVAYRVNSAAPANVASLFRFYNKRNGSHFYTVSAAERDNVIKTLSTVYAYEGPAYNVSVSGGAPLHRFYNTRNGSHFYTISEAERQTVQATLSHVYAYEGIAFYVGQ